jgi:demethylmenaquinone methyltransferase/2-methoxy-6-polyprenyl-1,4-benzoquinol methylase
MQLPFQENTFAAVTVGYGLRNLSDWSVGLREMVRVAQPGGRILVLDFGKPSCPPLRATYFGYLRVMVPLFGLLFCGNAAAYAYILESLRAYPAQEGVATEMRHSGLADVRIFNLLGGMMSINVGVKPDHASPSPATPPPTHNHIPTPAGGV